MTGSTWRTTCINTRTHALGYAARAVQYEDHFDGRLGDEPAAETCDITAVSDEGFRIRHGGINGGPVRWLCSIPAMFQRSRRFCAGLHRSIDACRLFSRPIETRKCLVEPLPGPRSSLNHDAHRQACDRKDADLAFMCPNMNQSRISNLSALHHKEKPRESRRPALTEHVRSGTGH